MKIRIKSDTIRFRLTRTEVEELCTRGQLMETTHFISNQFTYGLKQSKGDSIAADFTNNTITIHLPVSLIANWNTNSVVGFEHNIPLKGSNTLAILIEKDFSCLEERNEDETDNYPNPLAPKKNG